MVLMHWLVLQRTKSVCRCREQAGIVAVSKKQTREGALGASTCASEITRPAQQTTLDTSDRHTSA
jgi:hypothetical protein